MRRERRFYHRTTADGALGILLEGFRDEVDTYMTTSEHEGVWISDQPLDAADGAPVGPLFIITLDNSAEAAEMLARGEWRDSHGGYREWLAPATSLNAHSTVEIDEAASIPPDHGW